jgi:hypothetical protein
MPTGEYGVTDVPKKAIQAVDIVYQASTLLGAVGNTIPTEQISELRFKFDVTKGVPGEYDVQPGAGIDLEKLSVTQLSADLIWSRYQFMLTDDSKLYCRDGTSKTWDNAIRSATEYFAAVKDYQCIAKMVAGVPSSHAALGGTWDSATAQIENDILKGLQYIGSNSNIQNNEVISVLVPAAVYHETRKLDLIGNVQQQLRDYLQRSFNLDIRPFRAYKNSAGTAILDGLSTNCLIYVNGNLTCRHAQYSTAAAAAADFPLTERWRVEGRGDAYYQRMASEARVVWDGVQSTNTYSNRIYKVTGVTS